MSELKARHVVDVYDNYSEYPCEESFRVYLKSEVDKVIAELKHDVENWMGSYEASRRVNARSESKLRHSNYKRCLAMANWCCDAYDKWMMRKAKAIVLGKDGVKEYYQAKRKLFLFMRWQTRWLKIAEQFKEAE